jgi:hypothetical protein
MISLQMEMNSIASCFAMNTPPHKSVWKLISLPPLIGKNTADVLSYSAFYVFTPGKIVPYCTYGIPVPSMP